MSRPETKPQPAREPRWIVTLLFIVAMGVALWGLKPLLDDTSWWIQGMVIVMVVFIGAAAIRAIVRRRYWGTIGAALLAIAAMTLTFVAPTALLGLVPTWDSYLAFRELEALGLRDISTQETPAVATAGITFLVCLGVAVVSLAIDAVTHIVRAPAVAGFPLLVLLLVPSFVVPGPVDLAPFIITAVVWLAATVVYSGTPAVRTAIGVGAAALAIAIVVPLVVPPGEPAVNQSGPGTGFATGLNPMISLGTDLRRGTSSVALTYRTSDNSSQYLRLTALDDFTGDSWEPTNLPTPDRDVEVMGPAPGATDAVPVRNVTTNVAVADVLSRWLPVPYASVGIRGLEGDWNWEPDGLTVLSDGSNARDQDYQVDSVQAQPSVEQLVASGSGPFTDMDAYLALPDELPASVRETAATVTAGLGSHYEAALALQDFFRGGSFTYSESAPVDQDFDGSGAEVLGPFLEVKSGYCVHFSSAMAAMARSLGIPARVIVGFTPGQSVAVGENDEFTAYQVSTDNLHAWPELYFADIGWVRFEPTPGRGSTPSFAPLTEDDPTTPDVDESVPPAPAPDAQDAPEPSAAPETPDETVPDPTIEAIDPDATATPFPTAQLVALLAALLLLTPTVIRAARRARRLAAVGRGSALDGWHELRDTAYDLGLSSDATLTPRQLTDDLGRTLDHDGSAALARFRDSLESQAYAREGTNPAPRDLRRALRALRRNAGVARSVGATLAPRSLVRTWLEALAER